MHLLMKSFLIFSLSCIGFAKDITDSLTVQVMKTVPFDQVQSKKLGFAGSKKTPGLNLYDQNGKKIGELSPLPYTIKGLSGRFHNAGGNFYQIITKSGSAQFAWADTDTVFNLMANASVSNPIAVTLNPKTHAVLKVKSPSMGKQTFYPSAPDAESWDTSAVSVPTPHPPGVIK